VSWNVECTSLEDQAAFETLNGLWTGEKPPYAAAEVIRNTNFTALGRIDYSDVAQLQVEVRKLQARQLRPGDIIIERSGGGPKQPVGRVVFFDRDDGVYSFSNFTSVIRVIDMHAFLPQFVFFCLLALYRSGSTEDLQRRTTGIRNLDFTAYKARATFPRISASEQREIVATLNVVLHAIGLQEDAVRLTIELKNALMKHLFTEGLVPEGQQITELGPVPESWVTAPLGDIAELKSGGTPSRKKAEYWTHGTIPWVKTGEVDYQLITDTEELITPAGLAGSSARLFPAGTVLMAMYGQGVTRAKVAVLGVEAATNQACVAILPSGQVRAKYLYYFFEYMYVPLRRLGHGANQKNLSAEILKEFHVAYPAAGRGQDTIVSVLEDVDSAITAVRQKRQLLDELFDSLLQQLVSGAARLSLTDDAAVPMGAR
jgi:type I restriction enzyme S subunit